MADARSRQRVTRYPSIRFRITALAALSVAIVLVLASIGLVGVHRRQLTANVDSALDQRARDLGGLLATANPGSFDLAATLEEGFAQVLSWDGAIIASSPNLLGAPPLPIPYQAGTPKIVQTIAGLAIDDDVFRVLSGTLQTASGPGVIHIGATLDEVAESTAALSGTLAISIPVVVAVLAGVVWWLVGRTLMPVETIRRQVAEIGATDLHRRVLLPSAMDEIGRLAETMNNMLERLEGSVARQQRFVGDASHELRTPLARMRSEIEVDLATRPQNVDQERLHSLLQELIAIQRTVEDLLVLARLDADRLPLRDDPVDLDDLVVKEAMRLKGDGRILVDMSGVSGAHVAGDAHQLARAIRNLSDNAERHALREVTFTLKESAGKAVLTIGDDGPGIPQTQAGMIFERFVRVDQARGQSTGGSGLGLAITREIIERHGGVVEMDPSHGPGARFVVTLPLR